MAKKKSSKSKEGESEGTGAKMTGKQTKQGDRSEAYRELAERFATGAAVPLPTMLTGHDRRLHVRAALLEDHAHRIDMNAQGTQEKFDVLAQSLYSFFRGTALLYYRDMAGADANRPKVLLLGDVHPGNFGVMPNADNVPIFSVNDFDEVTYGPYSWDLRRGATGFWLAAKCQGGLHKKKRRKIVRKFVGGYIDGLKHFAIHASETTDVYRRDNAPDIICKLIDDAMSERADWLSSDHQDEKRKGFRPTDELQPVSSRVEEFQGYVDALAKRNEIETGGRCGELKVKDVAIRHGAGCASLGLARYYVMLEGPDCDGEDDIVLEFKRARRSALDGIVPTGDLDPGGRAERIANGQRVHLPHGDVFYGWVEIDGESFMTRERAPFRDDIDLDDLDFGEWKEYAKACGFALALAHARSDDVGEIDYDVEPAILEDMEPHALFVDDIVNYCENAAKRLKRDWKEYRKDWELGAFTRRYQSYG